MVTVDKIQTRLATLERLPSGILGIGFQQGVGLDMAGVTEVLEARVRLAGGRRVPVMVVLNADSFGEVRINLTDHSPLVRAPTLCEAPVAPPDAVRRLTDLYYGHHQPPFPTAIFEHEEEALAWLEAQC